MALNSRSKSSNLFKLFPLRLEADHLHQQAMMVFREFHTVTGLARQSHTSQTRNGSHAPLTSLAGHKAARWSTPLLSKSTFLTYLHLRALCGEKLVTYPADFRGVETLERHPVDRGRSPTTLPNNVRQLHRWNASFRTKIPLVVRNNRRTHTICVAGHRCVVCLSQHPEFTCEN